MDESPEEEDVPADFFDDFSNKDFLAGLDVVDDCEDTNDIPNPDVKAEVTENECGKTIQNADTTDKLQDSKDLSNNTDVEKVGVQGGKEDALQASKDLNVAVKNEEVVNEKLQDSKELRDVSKENNNSSSRRPEAVRRKRSPSRDKRFNDKRARERFNRSPEANERRDPLKTKRDIQRDKIKCARDKEAKLISEKLKVVETGLVPPGMEMDVDLPEIVNPETNIRASQDRKNNRSRSPQPNLKRRYRYSPGRSPRRSHHRSSHRSPLRSTGRSPFRTGRSPFRTTARSPVRKAHSPIRTPRSPRRTLGRSPFRSGRSPRRRSPSPKYSRYKYSPQRDRRQGRNSPDSNRDNSRHSKETSPSRKRTFLEELDHKLKSRHAENTLRSVQEKLNGPMPNYPMPVPAPLMSMQVPAPMMNPMPVPAPMMNSMVSPMPMQQMHFQQSMYDNPQYFIGENHNLGYMNQESQSMAMYNRQPYYENVLPQPHPQPKKYANTPDLDHLFNNEKVSLSKYLKAAEKAGENGHSIDISSKIQVLARCQEALKIMTECEKPVGRFYFKKSCKLLEKPPEMKNQSPMKRVPSTRFNYTTKMKQPDERLSNPINRILLKLGLKDLPPLSVKEASSATEVPSQVRRQDREHVLRMTQTEPFKCDSCEERKKVETANKSTQCQSSVASFACQVTEDDFLSTARSALQNILKNQSLATLTPAQIMAQSEIESKKETTPRKPFKESPEKSRFGNRSREEDYDRRNSSRDFDLDRSDDEYIQEDLDWRIPSTTSNYQPARPSFQQPNSFGSFRASNSNFNNGNSGINSTYSQSSLGTPRPFGNRMQNPNKQSFWRF